MKPLAVARIRAATSDDAGTLAALHTEGWQQGYRGLLPDDYLDSLDVADAERSWASRLANPHGLQVLIAEDASGQALGFCSIGRCFDPDAAGAHEIWDAWVSPDARSHGVGGQLLAACLALAPEDSDVVVWVLAQNQRGRDFYTRHGAVDDGMRRSSERAGGLVITDVRLRWRRSDADMVGQRV